ncbi:MAG: hypothetical protein LUE16_11805 [Lachnospiraceae bacterium]|nr:hypothetical protein [Lachnospiraceae bacterium]
MRYYNKNTKEFAFEPPSTKLFVLGAIILLISVIFFGFWLLMSGVPVEDTYIADFWEIIMHYTNVIWTFLLIAALIIMLVALVFRLTQTEASKIRVMIEKGLFCYAYGNPLNFKEGERLPKVKCKCIGDHVFELSISATTSAISEIQNISSSISSCLNKGKYLRYAVTQTDTDVAYNEVRFIIEDVTVNHTVYADCIDDLIVMNKALLLVQDNTYIDLTTSGSTLCAGKTRSGKTTAIASLLLQVLAAGRDNYGSEVMIVDPKQAELSRLPHVYTLDDNGEARGILQAIQCFADSIRKRQKVLNDMSEKKGDAVKWWDAGFEVSCLFIDEYVALRSLLPKRTGKEDDYSLATFDALIKRIVTMGASAGCYVIISIAEASVEEGGLPAMLRSAMTTKILFKPTLPEARLLWDSDKLKDLPERVYNAGDAWFSSTDGVHDRVSYVHFPVMRFPVYSVLGEYLDIYYHM